MEVGADAEEIVQDFQNFDYLHLVDAIQAMQDILKTVENGVHDCLSKDMKLKSIINALSSPKSFEFHANKDLIINGVDIYSDLKNAVNQYKNKNFTGFGENLGKALAKIPTEVDNKTKVAEIMQGMLQPYGGKFNLEALLICIYEEDQAALAFDIAVQAFETAWKNKEIEDAIGGVIAVVAGVQQFKQGLPACEAIDKAPWNIQEFETCVDIAVHPTEYFKVIENDVKINGISILEDAAKGVEAYKRGDFLTFGLEMGSILKLATEALAVRVAQEDMPKPDANMAAEVAQGFLESTNVGTFNFTNLLICIYEADQAALILDEGVKMLEQAWHDKDIEEAIPGVIAAVAFVQQLKQSIPVCESIDTKSANWSTFDHIVEVAQSPIKHMQLIEKDITFNGVKITEELSDAVESFRSGNYREYGYQLGKLMTTATQETEQANLFLY